VSMWAYSYITSDWSGGELLIPQILRGFPQVFAVAPAVNLGLGSLPPERLKYASGLFNMMRNLGGAVGIAACGAILNDRTNFHFNMIASHLTPANGPMDRLIAGLTQRYAALPGSLDGGHVAALKELWLLAYREASTLAYADAFSAIMAAFVVATLLVPLLRNVARAKLPPPTRTDPSRSKGAARHTRDCCVQLPTDSADRQPAPVFSPSKTDRRNPAERRTARKTSYRPSCRRRTEGTSCRASKERRNVL
jgi:MFS transporter, DHA2 family, multidrug resistance protein